VFPDVGFGGLQRELISQGFPVWGHHGGDVIETNRGLFLKTLEDVGMQVPGYKVIQGLTALREHLRDLEDKWIKISKWRGDWETLHWRDWSHDESTLDCYAYQLGPAKDLIKFYVFDSIETDIEDGIDTYCIDGEFPSVVMHGCEMKDKGYVCSVQELSDIDKRVSIVNERFSPILKQYGYRGFFSSEVRIKDDLSYFIDPTCRSASPPSQVMVELFENIGEIIWRGANGECIDPLPTAQFGVQVLMSIDRDKNEWAVMDIPDSIRQWVKCGFSCEINGRVCIPPHQCENMIGWLVATGDTIDEAIKNLKDYAEELPEGVDCDVYSIAHIMKEMQTAKEEGIDFSDHKIPDPSSVIDS